MTATAPAPTYAPVPIGDLCEFLNGGTPSKANVDFWNGDIPWITSAEINDGEVAPPRFKITQDAIDESSTRLVPAGSLLLVIRTGVGKVGIAPYGLTFNQDINAVLPDPKRLDKQYLRRFLESQGDHFEKFSRGATVKGITREHLGRLAIPLPFPDDPRRSLAEQKRIAAILDKADAIRRRRQEAARLADTLIPSVFHEMFGDPVLNPRRYDTEPLGSLADMVSGGTPSKSVPEFWTGSLPWVSPKDMKRPYLADATDHITEDGADDANLKVLQPGAILIVVRGMILAHTVPLAINLAPLTINQDMRAFVPHDGIEAEYLCWALRMQHGRLLSLVTNAAHGTKRFESRDLFALSIPLPPKPQQKRFAALVESTRLARQRWEAGSDNAEDLFNSLVQRAFRGEL